MFPKLRKISIIFLFILIGLLMVHSFASISIDIGRHLTLGKIILETKSVPDTNMFSYVEPDFPFINHHWLSEVVFYLIHSISGFEGIILLKVALVLLSFIILFFSVRKRQYWPCVTALILSIFIFIERSEARPEIFSFIIFALFLFILFRAKYSDNRRAYRWLWILPVLEVFWVNFHIYFFIGPFLIFIFFIDRLLNKRNSEEFKRKILLLIAVGALTGLATVVNPNGIKGALEPFRILGAYGYNVAENKTPFFIWDYVGFNLSILFLFISIPVLIAGFLATIKNVRRRAFEIMLSAFLVYASLKMLRNLSLYALGTLPIMAIVLSDVRGKFQHIIKRPRRKPVILKIALSALILGAAALIILVASNNFYTHLGSPKDFGLSIPNSSFRAIDFVKQNNIKGPVFNNFDIGGFLVWQLYPGEQVFVDNRPEAYSVSFFRDIYIEMQSNREKWNEISKKYGINYVFWNHRDMTPWGQRFVKEMGRDPLWQTVYINEGIAVFVKDIPQNQEIISKYAINKENAIQRIEQDIQGSNEDKVVGLVRIARVTWALGYFKASVHFASAALDINPDFPHAHLILGLSLAASNRIEAQEQALFHVQKAIDLGMDTADNYLVLAMLNINLGHIQEALDIMKRVEKMDPGNKEVKKLMKALNVESL